jgi:hypothetical protein
MFYISTKLFVLIFMPISGGLFFQKLAKLKIQSLQKKVDS